MDWFLYDISLHHERVKLELSSKVNSFSYNDVSIIICLSQIDLPFLPERMKIGKVKNFVAKLYYKNKYAVHIQNSKQALNHELV